MKNYNIYYADNYKQTSNPRFVGQFSAENSFAARQAGRDKDNPNGEVFNYIAKLPADDKR